jgi:hypothetical protein
MATVRLTLPDDPAWELATSGLLEPQTLETILRDRLKATRIADPLNTPNRDPDQSGETDDERGNQRRDRGLSARD